MIAKGTAHNNGAKLATYLITGKGDERAELFQLRGFASDDIRDAFRSVHVIAEATRAEQPFFHVQVRTPNDENLTDTQWERVADRIEAKLGFADQPRAIAFHTNEKTGHRHMHIAWSRIDVETMTARAVPFYKLRLKEVCREIEIEMGLTRVTSERHRPNMAPSRAEFEQARRLGIDIHQVRTTIRECWEQSDNGASFRNALSEHDLMLCRGDRSYVVVDRAGGMHALGKRIFSQTAAEIHARLSDLENLPTLEQARMQLDCPLRTAELDKATFLSAIEERDAGAILAWITKRRATFTLYDLERALSKSIYDRFARNRFSREIISHPDAIQVTGRGTTARYSTRIVLSLERAVLDAAATLITHAHHEVAPPIRMAVLREPKYDSISREQVRALRHATGASGLALIAGQAGTGKSYVIGAIRETYENAGCRVIGLAPTNIVARSMKEDGFAHAETLHGQLYALDKKRTRWDEQTVIILDEAAMVDTRNLAKLTAHAKASGAKLILIGDDRQLPSIEHGGMFEVLKNRCKAAEMTEVRRQHNPDDRMAAELMAKRRFREALALHEKSGGITWTQTPSEAAELLVNAWMHDHLADPKKVRFVFAYTNDDVDELNRALRTARMHRGELGQSVAFETTHGIVDLSVGDRIQFTGTDKKRHLYNGYVGTIQRADCDTISVILDGKATRAIEFDPRAFRDFRLGYAGTIYKGQGKTIAQTYLFHTEHWRAAASYVALTRHTQKTRMFVARDTAADLAHLARQMARLDDCRAASFFVTTGQNNGKPTCGPTSQTSGEFRSERKICEDLEFGSFYRNKSADSGHDFPALAINGNSQMRPKETPVETPKTLIRGLFQAAVKALTTRKPAFRNTKGRGRGGETRGTLASYGRLIMQQIIRAGDFEMQGSHWDAMTWLHTWGCGDELGASLITQINEQSLSLEL